MKIVREPTRVIASVFCLCGFVVAMIVGWRAGGATGDILLTAILAMVGCKILGLFVGWIGETAIRDFLTSYKDRNPVPSVRAAERAVLRGERPSSATASVTAKNAAA